MPGLLEVIAAGAPSKGPFYAAGAALALWAVVLSAFGLSRPGFPGSRAASRGVMGVSSLLVAATMATAVATASKPTKEEGREQSAAEGEGRPKKLDEGQVGGTSGGGAAPAEPGRQASPGGSRLLVAADPGGQLAFERKALTAKAGKVEIRFTNRSPVLHDVRIEAGGRNLGGTRQITGATTSAAVELKPGKYTFFCSVDAHRQAGMEGTLTVR